MVGSLPPLFSNVFKRFDNFSMTQFLAGAGFGAGLLVCWFFLVQLADRIGIRRSICSLALTFHYVAYRDHYFIAWALVAGCRCSTTALNARANEGIWFKEEHVCPKDTNLKTGKTE